MTCKLLARAHAWKLKEPFAISRGVRSQARVAIVELHQDGKVGRGEACGVPYHGETPETMLAQIEEARAAIESGCDRQGLLEVLPAGGARHALDAALWDLEAKQTGVPAWQRAGAPQWDSIASAVTIGIREVDAYEAAARERAGFPWLKVKVGRGSPLAAVAAVLVAPAVPKLPAMYWPAAASMAKHQLANRSFCAAAFVAAATGWVSCQLAPSTWVKSTA